MKLLATTLGALVGTFLVALMLAWLINGAKATPPPQPLTPDQLECLREQHIYHLVHPHVTIEAVNFDHWMDWCVTPPIPAECDNPALTHSHPTPNY